MINTAIVVGYGSIGKRHASILEKLGLNVIIVSRRELNKKNHYSRLDEAIQRYPGAYIVIADETARHADTLRNINTSEHKGPILVEKPLFYSSSVSNDIKEMDVCVGYVLRFHPLIKLLRSRLKGKRIDVVEVVAGQYLPTWRPDRDYRDTYSSSRNMGGGVVRDLSHEIDLMLWLLGPWLRISATLGKSGSLEIDTEDFCQVLVEGEEFKTAILSINYLDRIPRRSITIQCDTGTISLDFIKGTLRENKEIIGHILPNKDELYRYQHEAILKGNKNDLCSSREGIDVVYTCEQIELAAASGSWKTI